MKMMYYLRQNKFHREKHNFMATIFSYNISLNQAIAWFGMIIARERERERERVTPALH
jgi:hypothetical protein